ncbi:MAG: uncharacterized membrane protein (DUF373 family) [Chlamydiales bacterium]|jgi:uncharacterized membrane protein (DUF373 family)
MNIITLYLRNDVIDVNLVVATALMAVARKVIIFDYNAISPAYIYATALTIISLGLTYWLLTREGGKNSSASSFVPSTSFQSDFGLSTDLLPPSKLWRSH